MGSGGGGYADWTQGYEINGKELIVRDKGMYSS
jgi:hypothetical protein